MVKALKLEGYGTIMINPINIKDSEYETVDPSGKSVKSETRGSRAKNVYINEDGAEIPNSQLCKKILVDDEEIIAPKFNQSKEVEKEDINELTSNLDIYNALDRKFYNAVTDSEQLKDLVINQGKTLEFPFVAGNGWKIWKGVLTNWNNKLLMVACRGNIMKELEKYDEETVSLTLDSVPQKQNMKKIMKMVM